MATDKPPPRHRQLAQEIADKLCQEFENIHSRGLPSIGGYCFTLDIPPDLSGAKIRVSALVAEVKLK